MGSVCLLPLLLCAPCWLPAAEGDQRAWAYLTPKRPAVPAISTNATTNPIDAFIRARLHKAGLTLSPQANRQTLLRRATYDLTGLPPTLAEQEAFLADDGHDAYERLVDRLLASPRYGERWAQHWLDLVRYAESDGFKADDHRPNAYRYRDYVIQALNDDLPYDHFIRQQLAGDELEPENPQALIATGYNRLWPDEYNAANLEQRRQEILDDVTEVTGFTFLGLTIGCARCHDHKFDPISQADYFRLQGFFAGLQARDDIDLLLPQERAKYHEQLAAWEEATKPLRAEMDTLMGNKREEMRKNALTKFRQEIQDAVLTPVEKRTPYQQQIALMAEQQINRADAEAAAKLPADKKKRYQELEKQMKAAAPKPPSTIMAISDVGREAPPTHLLDNGDWRKPGEELQPGFPRVLGAAPIDTKVSTSAASTGRRAALARWLTRPDHPLTARVVVNRLWQHHFGRGIVGTPNDFGNQGEQATHPELLDWLAVELVDHGWSLKHMHRLMLASATYRQSSRCDPQDPHCKKALAADPENHLLWHANRRRLEGEALHDAMLAVSGELNHRMHGPSCKPKLPEGISKYAWKADAKPEEQQRRSIYILAKRNMRYPMFDTFDLPDQHNSCARRSQTTTAPQALLMLNGEFARERAEQWAAELASTHGNDDRQFVQAAIQAAWGRLASEAEIELATRFLQKQQGSSASRSELCHVLLISNEFLYVD
jgi:hypothetical protein